MEDIEWNVVNEGQLLDAMVGHKPVGINKYFQMALICEKFADSLHKDINPEKIWAHLETMYNLEALDENESIPFPNNEKEFSLPEEFGELLTKREEEEKKIKETKKEPFTTPRRDSKDTKDNGKTPKKEGAKKEEKPKSAAKIRKEEKQVTPKPKRTRGSFKPNDDSGSSGKSSPVTVTPTSGKRRRVV